jgi:RNA polymerase sigma-70 factor, ECF subfamily
MGETIAVEMSSVGTDEDRLIARCRTGDLAAFEEVYTRWERPIFRHAYCMLRDAPEIDPDDVKQETFLKAFRSFGGFDGRCALRTWLVSICANVCRDRLKQRSRRPEVPLDQDAIMQSGQCDPIAAMLADADHEMILEALSALPVHHRQLLLLREVEGLSYEEIRDVLHCSMASVKLRLFRARQQWSKQYRKMAGEGDTPC